MARRIIALDTQSRPWRLAVARPGRPNPTLELVAELPEGEDIPFAERLRQALGRDPGGEDRLVLPLPATSLLVRWLEFPFAEAGKIRAALPAELARQLPCELDDRHLLHRLLPAATGRRALALAVDRQQIEEALATFDGHPLPLTGLLPLPFAVAEALPKGCEDGLLVCVTRNEISLLLLKEGQPCDLRVQSRGQRQKSIDQVAFIVRQGRIMLAARDREQARILLAGESADGELARALRQFGFAVEAPDIDCDGDGIAGERFTAAALALAATRRKGPALNALCGAYAPRGEWRQLRPRLIAACSLLAASLIFFLAAGWLEIERRQSRLDRLDRQLRQTYRQAFPQEKALVDPLLQLEARLKQLRKTVRVPAAGGQTPLTVLREVSRRVPTDVRVRIRDYAHTADGLRIEGETESFEAVSRLVDSLRKSPLFSGVKIADTRQQPDGKGVSFRLQLNWKEAG
ncbi:type II secretion system protein L [Geothermobacter ehrlichii]|uniref:Type II secretion system protein L n=1 Tax=Geothermobacter ehrlichii TaxID=213224 RepID=A0A5D3WL40_9BACT|nr:type II secretion system protein GspL [Geothermobacter ehrlichii]TYO97557.1 type II secretion system protein L [Geothermobacter ehrlichii]